MEATAVVIVAFVLLLGGVAVLWSRQGGTLPRALAPRLDTRGRASRRDQAAAVAISPPRSAAPIGATSQSAQTSPVTPAVRSDVATVSSEATAPVEPASGWDALAARLDRIEQSIAKLERAEIDRAAERKSDLRQAVAELSVLLEADIARGEATAERLRADLFAAIAGLAARAQADRSGRPRACAELYARLAGLETALGAVTNPVLLPGEPYLPPAELLPEALIWDNWNEVGEKAFAFAETFSEQRLHLSPETQVELSEFVTRLRLFLTGSIYPNVRSDLGADQLATLRMGLDDIAVALPQVRSALEREYGLK